LKPPALHAVEAHEDCGKIDSASPSNGIELASKFAPRRAKKIFVHIQKKSRKGASITLQSSCESRIT
jgi:hypothetical protein